MLASLAPARRRLVFALASLVVVGVIATVVVVLATRTTPAAPASQATPGPVVLVPGYGGSTGGLDQLADTLRDDGKDATVFDLPGDGKGDLDAQAGALATTVDAVLRRTGAASVDVIGYSAGGVVARLWAREHGGDTQARRVITLGSPQHGTDLATLAGSTLPGACPTACQQLATNSSLLRSLNAGDETPSGPTFVSIWTTHDDVVLPPGSASLDGALNMTVQSVCRSDRVTHSGLPTDATVQSMVREELRAGAPTRLTTTDCPSP